MKKKQLEQLLSDLLEKDHEIKRQQKYIDHLADQLMDSSINNMESLSRINDLEQECDKLTEYKNEASLLCTKEEHMAALRIKTYISQGACDNSCIDCIYYSDGHECINMQKADILVIANAIIRWWDNA